MSECHENIRLNAYHDGELSPDDAARVEAHLKQCPACARDLRHLRAISSRFASALIPDMRPLKLAQIHRAIEAEGDVFLLRLVRQITSVAAAVLVAGTVWLISTSSAPTAPPGLSSTALTIADWEIGALAPNAAAASEMASAGGDAQFAQFIVSDLSQGQ